MNWKRLFLLVSVICLFLPTVAPALVLTGNGNRLPLVDQRVRVTIDNQVAVTRLDQTFMNANDQAIEATLQFPLGEKASVQEFGLTGPNGIRRMGAIEEKQDAQAIYQNAQAQGAMPAIAQSTDPNSFETKVGTIPQKSKAVVDLTYSEILSYRNGIIQYQLPLNMKGQQDAKPELVSVTIDLKDQKEIVKVTSPTHEVSTRKIDDHHWQITFEKNSWLPEADFQLVYEVKAQKIGFNFLSTQPSANESGYFMMLVAPQEVITAEDIAARDIVFVMDISGSMQGRKIQQTKAAFDFFIEHLNADDRFGLIAYSDGVNSLNPKLIAADAANRQVARDFVSAQHAQGGTNIMDALQAALRMFPDGRSNRAIVFLTDGQPTVGTTDPRVITDQFKMANTKKIRTFVFGVGEDVNSQLLDQISLENYGETVAVTLHEELTAKLTSFYETISKPLLTDLALQIEGLTIEEMYPQRLPNVYKGSQVMITGRYRKPGAAKIILSGDLNGQRQSYPLEATFIASSTENRFVSRLWAKSKADALIQELRAYGEDQAKKNEVIRLSKQYQFTTPYTSFIAVAPEQVARPVDQFSHYRQPQAAPANNSFSNTTNNAVMSNQQAAMMAQSTPVFNPAAGGGTPQSPSQVTVVRETPAKPLNLWGSVGFFPAAIAVPNFRKAREQAREKACYANMRVLLGAVEMYNMDHSTFASQLDGQVMSNLYQGGYLKSKITAPETACAYYNNGDLAKNGIIMCALHGEVEEGSNGQAVPHNVNINVVDNTPWTTKMWNAWQPMIELAINIPLLIFGLWLSYLLFIKTPFQILATVFGFNTEDKPRAIETPTQINGVPLANLSPINDDELPRHPIDENRQDESAETDDEDSDATDEKAEDPDKKSR